MTYEMEGQLTFADLGFLSGKTSAESSLPPPEEKAKTSRSSSRKSSKSQSRQRLMCLCLIKVNGPTPDYSTMIWEDGALGGDFTMDSIGERPSMLTEESSCPVRHSGVEDSRLSLILQDSAPEYSLSAKACAGILRRAEMKNKKLPAVLEKALREQSRSLNAAENPVGAKEY